MLAEDYIKAQACTLAWREERSNGTNGMLGVLFVVRRRAQEWHAGDWLRVITDHGQFSSMTIAGDSQTILFPDTRDPEFQKIMQYVDAVYDGSMQDTLTNGALYYADLGSSGYQHGGWFDRNIIAKPAEHPASAKVGTTTFFK